MARKSERGMVVIEQGGGLLWLLVGGAIGAGLGLLLAPHSGRKTRRLLSERLQKLKDSAEAALDDLGEEDDEELPEEEPGDTAPALGGDEGSEEEGEDEEPKRPTGSARAELERRLAQARARRQRVYVDEDEEPVA